MKYFLITILFNICLFATAQIEHDYSSLENKVNINYRMKNWDEVITFGKAAIKNGSNNFYLRYMIGVSYYEKGKYRQAIEQFEKALSFNSFDQYAMEYLYYSYVFAGRDSDANALTATMPDFIRNKLSLSKSKAIESIYAEGGYGLCNNFEQNGNKRLPYHPVTYLYNDTSLNKQKYRETDLNGNSYYFHIGLMHNIGKRISLYHGFSDIGLSKEKTIETVEDFYLHGTESKITSDSILYTDNIYHDSIIRKVDKNTLQQFQYYLNGKIHLNKGWSLTAALHLINVRFSTLSSRARTESFYAQNYDTLLDPQIPMSVRTRYDYVKKDTSFINYVASLSLTKEFALYSLSPFVTYSNLNGNTQWQCGFEMTYYPFGNSDLYTNTTIVNHIESNKNHLIVDQMVGVKITDKLWVEGFFTLGNQTNYNEKNAFVVYNISDKINFKAGTSLILPLNKNIDISLRYQFIQKESLTVTYFINDKFHLINNKYNINSFIAGIKYKL